VKKRGNGCYESKNSVYFKAAPEAVTSHFEPILFAHDQVVKIIQHYVAWLGADNPEKEQAIVCPSQARIHTLKECYRQWRRFREDTYASTYAGKQKDPEEFKRRMLLLRKTPATTDEDARHPLAEPSDGSADGSADGNSADGEKWPEETCDVCHLLDHGSPCPWAERSNCGRYGYREQSCCAGI
jgi:hypothetical protein